ncbi:hypothetical protein lerEdw1_005340 [Lerista edwardsae]|nr:hypothetical protein lerEdw1_005340 [Lerista edwardsae]
MAQHKKRLQLSNLASDITTVSAYCVMRNPKNLLLEVKNCIVVGAKLSVAKAKVDIEGEKAVEEPEEKQAEETTEKTRDEEPKCLNLHEKSHLKGDAWFTATKYTWQQRSYDFDEDSNFEKEKDEQFFENAELYQKYKSDIYNYN